MSKKPSVPPAKTRSKRARTVVNDIIQESVERDADLKSASKKEDQQSPPRKRQRASIKSTKVSTSKKLVQGKPGRLAVLMNMPTDVFAEIASHLWPVDIINLARLNKYFRNMLMTRSSIHIWHSAMRNVPGLPDCPAEMGEPRYLALVFLKTCTSCGEPVNTKVDVVLRVRLCEPVIPLNTVPPGIISLIPCSGKIAPANARALREDIPGLLAEYEKKKRLNNASAFQTWTAWKKVIISARLEHAQKLKEFFELMESARNDRRSRLAELLLAIKKQDGFKVEIPAQHPAISLLDSSPITVCYNPPFPGIDYALNCPAVLDLYQTDRTTAEMEAQFESHREVIERYITQWKTRIQAHCSKLARQGSKVTTILESSLVVGNKPDPFSNLSDDLKLLLRADTFFSTPTDFSSRPALYSSLIEREGFLGTYTNLGDATPKGPPNLDGITWDSAANKMARKLLASLGMPNASYLDMTDKPIYICGRCHDTTDRTWEEMVFHYVFEQERYARIQKEGWPPRRRITYENEHDPKRCTKIPLVQYSGERPEDEFDLYNCKMCANALILEDVTASEEILWQHLETVHAITNPILDIHYVYVPQITEESEPSESGCVDCDDFSEGEGGCDYARNRHLYRSYGRRKRHHYRSRCYYDGEGDEEFW
ncbi:E3 ubiquitin-protein ligase TRIM13 [Rhizoctonia solani]|uniref:E3 ubiquitin-protein ligase TRIM13 n=1 Tax=Rhizoctonia solani TaxID=456999 RepID=A0A0K6GHS8_9AGAM|nr:E3 ubiquitin-protein ligase TRIM13 [Rhizoctonia solani]